MRADVIVISRRNRVRWELGLRLGLPVEVVTGRPQELSDIYVTPLSPKVAIIDVSTLFPSPDPSIAPPPPGGRLGSTAFMVVGFQTDSDALLAALREGIPIHLIERLTREDLLQMMSDHQPVSRLHAGIGRLCAERVLDYLLTSCAEPKLKRRQAEIPEARSQRCTGGMVAGVQGHDDLFLQSQEPRDVSRPVLTRQASLADR